MVCPDIFVRILFQDGPNLLQASFIPNARTEGQVDNLATLRFTALTDHPGSAPLPWYISSPSLLRESCEFSSVSFCLIEIIAASLCSAPSIQPPGPKFHCIFRCSHLID